MEAALAQFREGNRGQADRGGGGVFHSDRVAGAEKPLRAALGECDVRAPRIAVYSNTTAEPHGADTEALRDLLAQHLVKPVRFAGEIEAMYAAGARVFVECGPGKVLTGLASRTLGDRAVCISMDQAGRSGLLSLVHGVPIGRGGRSVPGLRTIRRTHDEAAHAGDWSPTPGPRTPISATAWTITNGRAEPPANLRKPKPVRGATVEKAFAVPQAAPVSLRSRRANRGSDGDDRGRASRTGA